MFRYRRCPDCEALPGWPHAEWCGEPYSEFERQRREAAKQKERRS